MSKKISTFVLSLLFFLTKTKEALAQVVTCPGGADGIDTAIGCIPVFGADSTPIIVFFVRWGVSIGGGIAFLLILYAGFMIISSQGVPDKLKAGQELLVASISGLLLLIFSVFMLEFIGVRILGLPL